MQQGRKQNAEKENFIETLTLVDESDKNEELKNK